MAVKPNTTTTAQFSQLTIKEIDFIERFQRNWDTLREILGIMRPIRKTPGTKLVSSKAKIVLQDGAVAEGDEVPFSQAEVIPVAYADLELRKYRKAVTAESVAKYGATIAVQKTDDALITELQTNILNEFYDFAKGGTLVSSYDTFQMAVSMAIGTVTDKFKKMRRDFSAPVVFVNTLDLYEYLGNAQITLQNANGVQYIKDFLGASVMIVTSEIDKGTVIATPADNIILYYIDPGDGDFKELGLDYTTGNGETNLIGIHKEGNYGRVMGETHALMGLKLWAEYIDGIAVVYINSGNLDPVTVAPETSTIYGYDPATLQTGVAVNGNEIDGTLNYISTGELASYWGPGNFLALKFGEYQGVKVGLVPTKGSGLAALDSDKNAAFVVDSPDQKLIVQKTVGGNRKTQVYSLSGLTLATAGG